MSHGSARKLAARVEPDSVLEFWFGNDLESLAARAKLWFEPTEEFDLEISSRFSSAPEQAQRGELDEWRAAPASALALVIVLDQFPRNLYRGTARAFEFDPLALEVALEAIAGGFDRELHAIQRGFFYLPLEHAEDVELQIRSVRLYEKLLTEAPTALRSRFEESLQYAQRHLEVIQRFGRFPHRNKVLGRSPTPEETRYLAEGGEAF